MRLERKRAFDHGIADYSEDVCTAHTKIREAKHMLLVAETSREAAAKRGFFGVFDMLQIHMLTNTIEYALPREIMQLVLDCACTVRCAATAPTYLYEYVTMRDHRVKTNIKCKLGKNCAGFVEFTCKKDVQCPNGHFNNELNECPQCHHNYWYLVNCEARIRYGSTYVNCQNMECKNCIEKKLSKGLIENNSGSLCINVDDIRIWACTARGKKFVRCCAECMKKINTLL
jgi:hypothetical protein